MRQVQVTVYKFEELAPKVQQRILSRFRDADSDDVTQCITDMFDDLLKQYHFMPDTQVSWSLSHCQGDGVAFAGALSPSALIGTQYERLMPFIDCIRVTHHGTYTHSNSTRVDITTSSGCFTEQDCDGVQRQLQEYVADVSRKLERMGYAEIELATSDDAIKENIDANEYEFYADGRIYWEQD